MFSHFKPMADNYAPGRGQFGPQGHDWQELERGLLTLLHTKYKSSGPHAFREDFFTFFPISCLWKAMPPRAVANLHPRGMIDRIYEGYHKMLVHT